MSGNTLKTPASGRASQVPVINVNDSGSSHRPSIIAVQIANGETLRTVDLANQSYQQIRANAVDRLTDVHGIPRNQLDSRVSAESLMSNGAVMADTVSNIWMQPFHQWKWSQDGKQKIPEMDNKNKPVYGSCPYVSGQTVRESLTEIIDLASVNSRPYNKTTKAFTDYWQKVCAQVIDAKSLINNGFHHASSKQNLPKLPRDSITRQQRKWFVLDAVVDGKQKKCYWIEGYSPRQMLVWWTNPKNSQLRDSGGLLPPRFPFPINYKYKLPQGNFPLHSGMHIDTPPSANTRFTRQEIAVMNMNEQRDRSGFFSCDFRDPDTNTVTRYQWDVNCNLHHNQLMVNEGQLANSDIRIACAAQTAKIIRDRLDAQSKEQRTFSAAVLSHADFGPVRSVQNKALAKMRAFALLDRDKHHIWVPEQSHHSMISIHQIAANQGYSLHPLEETFELLEGTANSMEEVDKQSPMLLQEEYMLPSNVVVTEGLKAQRARERFVVEKQECPIEKNLFIPLHSHDEEKDSGDIVDVQTRPLAEIKKQRQKRPVTPDLNPDMIRYWSQQFAEMIQKDEKGSSFDAIKTLMTSPSKFVSAESLFGLNVDTDIHTLSDIARFPSAEELSDSEEEADTTTSMPISINENNAPLVDENIQVKIRPKSQRKSAFSPVRNAVFIPSVLPFEALSLAPKGSLADKPTFEAADAYLLQNLGDVNAKTSALFKDQNTDVLDVRKRTNISSVLPKTVGTQEKLSVLKRTGAVRRLGHEDMLRIMRERRAGGLSSASQGQELKQTPSRLCFERRSSAQRSDGRNLAFGRKARQTADVVNNQDS